MIHVQLPAREAPPYPTGTVPHSSGTPRRPAPVGAPAGSEHWYVVDSWPLEQRAGYYRGEALRNLVELGSSPAGCVAAVVRAQHYLEKLHEVARDLAAQEAAR